MSKTTKIKHVTKEVLEDYVLPTEKQEIVRILSGKGNNLHEVEDTSGSVYLVSMPTKFRKNIWVKRVPFNDSKFCIMCCLLDGRVAQVWHSCGFRPKAFDDSEGKGDAEDCGLEDSGDDDDDDDLFVNTNRPSVVYEESESSSTDTEAA
ncbi:unnamed protein product [Ixodes hexagonus]